MNYLSFFICKLMTITHRPHWVVEGLNANIYQIVKNIHGLFILSLHSSLILAYNHHWCWNATKPGCPTSKWTFSRLAATRYALLALLLLTVSHIPPVNELSRTSPLGSPARISNLGVKQFSRTQEMYSNL